MNQSKNTFAILSLVFGILSVITGCFCIGGLFGILGIVLYVISHKDVGTTKMNVAGLVTSIIGIILAVFMIIYILMNFSLNKTDTENSTDIVTESLTTKQEKTENESSTNSSADILTEETNNQENTITEPEEMNGRGRSDYSGYEPEYENVIGYVVVSHKEESSLIQSGNFIETPWEVPIYEKDKQFYVQNEVVEHKTEVIVKSQQLKNEGHGFYSGYLLVETTDTGEQFYIDVDNFLTKPYWTYNDLIDAVSVGYYIAEYKQVSDYYPVDAKNNKVELDDGTKVFVTGETGTFGSNGPDSDTNSIEGFAFKEQADGHGRSRVFFNIQDLSSIVY